MAQVKFSCGTVKVPLDYDNPTGATVPIAMRRIEATDPAHKVGTLFLNPGGPGGSGVDFTNIAWALYGPEVRAKFDIVGFDPRGIARSDGLSCFDSFQQASRILGNTESFPLNRAEHDVIVDTNAKINRLCASKGQAIRNHLSTANVARDLDQLRQAVGDKQLSYAGYSYGTQIGNTYAAMFPKNVRAMVIDAVLDPVKWTTGAHNDGTKVPMTARIGSADGAQATLEQFFSLCRQAGPEKCPLVKQGDPAVIYRKLVDLTRKEPIRVDLDGWIMELTHQQLVGTTLQSMYGSNSWDSLAALLSAAADQADVAKLPKAANTAALKKKASRFAGAPMPSLMEGSYGVICEDSSNPTDPEAWWTTGRRLDRRSYFGSAWTYGSAHCAQWSMKDTDRYMGPFTTTTANPVLVVGNLYDPATPYAGAQAANRNIRNSRLLTVAGWGHTALGMSKCADTAVEQYLVNGKLPDAGTTCQPDHLPFSTPTEIVGQQSGTAARAQMKAKLQAQQFVSRAALGGVAWTNLHKK